MKAAQIWGYEALVRGVNGEGAGAVLSKVTDENRYAFDQACRVKAIELAGAKLRGQVAPKLSINFMPNAVYEPRACIQASLAAAERAQFDTRHLMFEFTENEEMRDTAHVKNIVEAYRHMGFTTAIDDFGAGYAGLGLLANLRPDLIKIDMELIRGIGDSADRRVIVSGIVSIARALGIEVIAEGIETRGELDAVRSCGVDLVQGYIFAKPMIETFQSDGELDGVKVAA
ncbi:EAL domain, c-di-GMP-specific phosphodiesterase class I (or its enzymatically inactive variant) [Pelagibacterium luteolum]|uniref:EAL domain, c-di-GMP-specific phosphodiesterase class I (Or its enzymatically inactive variant) n=1 Tax=Pelagibacterium luteolum TaxID=440168 RepID=A0A1G7UEK5_9HYPH|nr:EAL domain, c-di-GMP-specific phosphodiesterase class I (or its enzymatically inactive variant) [Pelagibacterium luteolum]